MGLIDRIKTDTFEIPGRVIVNRGDVVNLSGYKIKAISGFAELYIEKDEGCLNDARIRETIEDNYEL